VTQDSTTAESGISSARITITKADRYNWHVQFQQPNIAMVTGIPLTVTFWAKASSARTIGYVLQSATGTHPLYTSQPASLTTSWQRFTVTYTPSVTDSNIFLGFNVDQATGSVWIDNVSVT
jgi:hypothetical protein